MSIPRPTYHESWYRIAGTKPRLRSLVQSFRQRYRGQTFHVLRDPSANKFFRLHEASYRFVSLLDGQRTIDQAWLLVDEAFGDEAPTQGEVIQLLGQLYVSNLLAGDMPPDATGLFERYRKRIRKEVGGYLLNILFTKIPIWDPDRFLDRWIGATSWLFGPIGILLWIVLLACGGWAVTGRIDQLLSQGMNVLEPSNLFTLYLATVVSKVIHELGHGFACKRFGKGTPGGGEVHTIGIMLIALIPMPYVDASSTWAFRNKWKRAFVGAAGMYVELAMAAIAAIVWSQTASDAWIHAFAYNVLFVAGVSTILFNGNPLIKFDGYYILSDVLEMPNLQQRSYEMFRYFWKKYLYGIARPHRPTQESREAVLLLIYCIASLIYKVFISVIILLFVAGQLFFIGMIMAIGGIIGLLLAPMIKFLHYLLTGPELERHRARAVVTTALVCAAVVGLLAIPKLPHYGHAKGVAESTLIVPVYAQADGTLTDSILPIGQVTRDQPIAKLNNPYLMPRVAEAKAHHAEVLALSRSISDKEPAAAKIYQLRIDASAQTILDAEEDLANLDINAPSPGLWIPNTKEDASGVPITTGDLLGHVISPTELRVRLATDQYVGPKILAYTQVGSTVQLRPAGRPDLNFIGTVRRIVRTGQDQLPAESLSAIAGGDILTAPTPSGGERAAQDYFVVIVQPAEQDAERFAGLVRPGQRITARFRWPDASLLQQVNLAARQVLQKHLGF